MAFTCTSLPFNLYTFVFGRGCGFGFGQKFWWIDGFVEKRYGSADLHTLFTPPPSPSVRSNREKFLYQTDSDSMNMVEKKQAK